MNACSKIVLRQIKSYEVRMCGCRLQSMSVFQSVVLKRRVDECISKIVLRQKKSYEVRMSGCIHVRIFLDKIKNVSADEECLLLAKVWQMPVANGTIPG